MERTRNNSAILALTALTLALAPLAKGQPQSIDTAKSMMTVHVYKAGALSAFGHDHEISAPIARGTADVKGHKVELHVSTAALRVADAKASDKDRSQIQATMLGPEVLDADNHKEISFQSTGAEEAGTGVWNVTGNLTLHGQTRPVSMQVRENNGHFAGSCRFRITQFGMKPVKVAGGTVSVKDEVQIEFDIQLAR